MVTDLAQGSVPALLPFLRNELHLSYTRTAAIMLAATIASSVVQPIFGHLFDTRRGEWLLVAGPAVAGLGIGALAFAHTFAARPGLRAHRQPRRRGLSPGGEQVRGLALGGPALDRHVGVLGGGQSGGRAGPAPGRADRVAIRPRRRLAARHPRACDRRRTTGRAGGPGRGDRARARAHASRRARPLGPDGTLAGRPRRARLRAFRTAHVHPAARARRASQQPRVRLARARADALCRRRRDARRGPAGRPLRPAAGAHALVPGRLPGRGALSRRFRLARPRRDRHRRRRRHLDVRHHDRRLAGVPADPASRRPPASPSASRSASAASPPSRSGGWPTPSGWSTRSGRSRRRRCWGQSSAPCYRRRTRPAHGLVDTPRDDALEALAGGASICSSWAAASSAARSPGSAPGPACASPWSSAATWRAPPRARPPS